MDSWKPRGLVISVLALTSVVVPCALMGQAGVYRTLPLENGVWCMSTACTDNGCGDHGYIRTYSQGDTAIAGSVYSVMRNDLYPESDGTCCPIPVMEQRTYIREDTIARKVYVRTDLMTSDSLLYDFTLNVGDTLHGYLSSCATTTYTVQSIDSILIGGVFNKRFNFDTADVCNWLAVIEGIGATTGLTSCFSEPWDSGIYLQCVTVDGNIQYYASCGPDTAGCAALPLGIGPPVVRGDGNSGCVLLRISSDLLVIGECQDRSPSAFSIFDNVGRVCLTGAVVDAGSAIHLGMLHPGLYGIRVSDVRGEVLITEKFFQP